MRPTDFKQSTKVLRKPTGMSNDECSDLNVWSDGKQCVSCWKASLPERIRIALGGKIWLCVLSGKTQPPVYISGKSIFSKPTIKAHFKAYLNSLEENIAEAVKNVLNALKMPDKRKHLIAGFCISLITGIFLPLAGLLLGCTAGLLKEWWDSQGHGEVELMDFICTCIGAALAFPISLILHNLIW